MGKKIKHETIEVKKRSMLAESMMRLFLNKSAMFGLIILLIIILMCAFAKVICPEGYNTQNIADAYQLPGGKYIFGTDNLGRSMLARVLYGGQVSLLIGFTSTVIAAAIGIVLGMLAAFYGGVVDNTIMRIMDVINSIPNLLLAVLVSACLGGGTVNTIIAVAVSSIAGFARTVRGPMLAIMGQEYIEAARSIDAKDRRIMMKHILPNVLSPIIVQFTMGTAISILCVSSLSFLGMGIQPPNPEWGSLLSAGRQYLTKYPHLCVVPGVAIALVVFSMNLFGDGLRDALDPRLKV